MNKTGPVVYQRRFYKKALVFLLKPMRRRSTFSYTYDQDVHKIREYVASGIDSITDTTTILLYRYDEQPCHPGKKPRDCV